MHLKTPWSAFPPVSAPPSVRTSSKKLLVDATHYARPKGHGRRGNPLCVRPLPEAALALRSQCGDLYCR